MAKNVKKTAIKVLPKHKSKGVLYPWEVWYIYDGHHVFGDEFKTQKQAEKFAKQSDLPGAVIRRTDIPAGLY